VKQEIFQKIFEFLRFKGIFEKNLGKIVMKRFIFISTLVLGFALSIFAQNGKSPCPSIDVSSGGVAKPGEPAVFTAEVKNAINLSALVYEWTVSHGQIVSGAGTPTITVDTTGTGGFSITATVVIKGLPENCENTRSETNGGDLKPNATLVDEFGRLPDDELKVRLDEMYLKVGKDPNLQGYIINYGTDREIAAREKQIWKVTYFRKYDPSRVTIVRGGANPNGKGVFSKVWIVPPGADNPQP
jgi:hypothetical protein